ncbi:Ubiquinone/menaquinone biosynthesis C-methylase UbiE [Enhydrobacter aerosaccus]|uniref:Ubiquinone/menaquinone biosynthesis C-methylase UbiE n=1 Tax=Enhydrobacter aerosaccus TaxID=225324 RepID=A0A1T4MTV7_9HYPH|nr:class I SAM-dependent methyltransferase [Enhydrobacter aerosaccus]SJZ70286.1 Ubiquinone/menaquinone biosynthesis C-methylase UbiE [Enhydrobacter aerosaccus]
MADLASIAAALQHATDKDVLAAFPAYTRQPLTFELNALERILFPILKVPTEALIRLLLRPRRGAVGGLDQAEVDAVYDKEAAGYDVKHHRTTRGQDLFWRRAAGWLVASAPEPRPRVLDLCTGTGLTALEIVRVLAEHGRTAEIVGLDYNEAMLVGARNRREFKSSSAISFVRGDATKMTGQVPAGFQALAPASFDIVVQVFGIGGIGDPVAVAGEALSVLREGGRFLLIDMHRPILGLPGEIPLPGAWVRVPRYELYAYADTTLPLVLSRLWGWRDPTLDFYLAPLVCREEEGVPYGFRLLWRIVESERWWFGLPMMPTCRLLLEKVRLDRTEYERRRRILTLIGAEPS